MNFTINVQKEAS